MSTRGSEPPKAVFGQTRVFRTKDRTGCGKQYWPHPVSSFWGQLCFSAWGLLHVKGVGGWNYFADNRCSCFKTGKCVDDVCSETSRLSHSICFFLARCAPWSSASCLCLLLGPRWPFLAGLGCSPGGPWRQPVCRVQTTLPGPLLPRACVF